MSGLYGTSQITAVDEAAQSDDIFRCMLLGDILSESDENIAKFCESAEADVFVEAQILNKNMVKTITHNTKAGQRQKRVKMICYVLAKKAGSKDWDKIVFHTKKRNEYRDKIFAKYGKQAERIAKIAEKEYVKKAKAAKSSSDDKKDK